MLKVIWMTTLDWLSGASKKNLTPNKDFLPFLNKNKKEKKKIRKSKISDSSHDEVICYKCSNQDMLDQVVRCRKGKIVAKEI